VINFYDSMRELVQRGITLKNILRLKSAEIQHPCLLLPQEPQEKKKTKNTNFPIIFIFENCFEFFN